jgi:hypothetical protein
VPQRQSLGKVTVDRTERQPDNMLGFGRSIAGNRQFYKLTAAATIEGQC